MAGPSFNPEDSKQREAANAANRQRIAAQFEADAAARAQAPATEKPTATDVKNGGGGGWMKNSFAAAVSAVNGMKEGMSNTIDGLAIKPYQGATSVDHYNIKQQPGQKL